MSSAWLWLANNCRIGKDKMSMNSTLWAAALSPNLALAPESSPPVEPEPEGDVVEAYSFNTGQQQTYLLANSSWHAYCLVSHSCEQLDTLFRTSGPDDDPVCFSGPQNSSKVMHSLREIVHLCALKCLS